MIQILLVFLKNLYQINNRIFLVSVESKKIFYKISLKTMLHNFQQEILFKIKKDRAFLKQNYKIFQKQINNGVNKLIENGVNKLGDNELEKNGDNKLV